MAVKEQKALASIGTNRPAEFDYFPPWFPKRRAVALRVRVKTGTSFPESEARFRVLAPFGSELVQTVTKRCA